MYSSKSCLVLLSSKNWLVVDAHMVLFLAGFAFLPAAIVPDVLLQWRTVVNVRVRVACTNKSSPKQDYFTKEVHVLLR
jgi:hypothetical protein